MTYEKLIQKAEKYEERARLLRQKAARLKNQTTRKNSLGAGRPLGSKNGISAKYQDNFSAAGLVLEIILKYKKMDLVQIGKIYAANYGESDGIGQLIYNALSKLEKDGKITKDEDFWILTGKK